jgi:hypothetical protein
MRILRWFIELHIHRKQQSQYLLLRNSRVKFEIQKILSYVFENTSQFITANGKLVNHRYGIGIIKENIGIIGIFL